MAPQPARGILTLRQAEVPASKACGGAYIAGCSKLTTGVWSHASEREKSMSRRNFFRIASVVGLSFIHLTLFNVAASAQSVKVQGLIIGRSGAEMIVQASGASDLVVVLTDSTDVSQVVGMLVDDRLRDSLEPWTFVLVLSYKTPSWAYLHIVCAGCSWATTATSRRRSYLSEDPISSSGFFCQFSWGALAWFSGRVEPRATRGWSLSWSVTPVV